MQARRGAPIPAVSGTLIAGSDGPARPGATSAARPSMEWGGRGLAVAGGAAPGERPGADRHDAHDDAEADQQAARAPGGVLDGPAGRRHRLAARPPGPRDARLLGVPDEFDRPLVEALVEPRERERLAILGGCVAPVDAAILRVGQDVPSAGEGGGGHAEEHQRDHDEHPGRASEQGIHPVTGTGGVGPQGVADRTGGPGGGQGGPGGSQHRLRAARGAGVAALAGWSLLAVGGGGIDPGDGLGGPGPRAAFLALALGAPLAAALLALAWDGRALHSGPGRLALGACLGMAAWAALSILWAAAPDLAWTDANRQAIALCAVVAGLSLGALLPGAARLFALGLSAAAALPVGIALCSKILPGLLGSDGDLARLSAPVGYWNALALVAVLAVPGLLWLAGGAPRTRWGVAVAAAGLCAVLVTVILTYSRGGLLSLVAAAAVTLAVLPRRGAGLTVLAAAALGAALPAAYALTDQALSTDQLPTALREDAGAGLGWRLALGLVGAAALALVTLRLVGDRRLDRARARRVALIVAAAVIVGAAAGIAASAPARDWTGDRVAEFRGEGGDAVANDPSRLVSASGNQRRGWWEEAWRGFAEAPVTGQGAGGFALVHLAERDVGDNALNTREPHGVILRFLSGTGLVGLALFAALIGAVVWAALRAAGRAGPDVGLPLAVLAAFLLQAVVDLSWAVPALTVPALAAAGIVIAAAAPGRGPSPRRPRGIATGAVTALTLAAMASAFLPWWSSHLTAAGEDALAGDRARAALRDARDAHAANPLSIAPLLLRARAYDALDQRSRALGAYREATRLQPDNPAAWRALALFLGPDRAAIPAWTHVRRLDPANPEAAIRGDGG